MMHQDGHGGNHHGATSSSLKLRYYLSFSDDDGAWCSLVGPDCLAQPHVVRALVQIALSSCSYGCMLNGICLLPVPARNLKTRKNQDWETQVLTALTDRTQVWS